MNNIKHKIIDEIEKSVEIFKRQSAIQYIIRCPICGDSQSDPKDAHCYLKCSYDPTEPILFNCFKCNAGGKVGTSFLKKLHINTDQFSGIDKQIFNKLSSTKRVNIDILTGTPIIDSAQVKYIERRLGKGFRAEDYDRFKIVWSLSSLYPYITDLRIKNTLPSNMSSISFLSDDKATLLTRFFGDEEPRWKKTNLFQSDKAFYTIKTTMDLFTKEEITVNIGEGIFDALSIYKNFNDGDNSLFVAALGSDYEAAVDYIIEKGFFGGNVTVKLYIDEGINERKLKYRLRKYRWLFNRIYLYKNMIGKDVGVKVEEIKLIEYPI